MDASVIHLARNQTKRPFPSYNDNPQHQINDLERRNWQYETIESVGCEVPCDLWPNKALDRTTYLNGCCNQHYEPRPLVFYESAHNKSGEAVM